MCAVGFDNLPQNFQLILSNPVREATGATGAPTQDVARPHHTTLLTGAGIAWGQVALSNLTYLTLAGTPDYINIAAAAAVPPTDMNFGTAPNADAFTLAMWIYITNLAAENTLICYGEDAGVGVGSGYNWAVAADGSIHLETHQVGAGATQDTFSAAGVVTINNWWFLVVTCDGAYDTAQVYLYRNAIDVTNTHVNHVVPATAAAWDMHIGAHETGVPGVELGLIGNIWNPRIWERALPQIQIWEIFEMERAFFGV